MYSVHTHELRQCVAQILESSQVIQGLAGRLEGVSDRLTLGEPSKRLVSSAIHKGTTALKAFATKTDSLSSALTACADCYDKAEQDAIDALTKGSIRGSQEGSPNTPGTGDNSSQDTKSNNVFWDFLKGDMKASGAVSKGKISGSTPVFGMLASGVAAGELVGGSASFKPKLSADLSKGNVYAGVKGSAEGHVAQGTLSGDYGFSHGDAKVKALTGAVEGGLEASLFRDGKLDPSLKGSASAKASVLSGEANIRQGTENFNSHISASGDLLTAKAGVSGHIGADGIGAKAEAGAYAASGSISGGLTLFGIKIDATLKGHAGGAGVEAGFGADKDKVSAEIGAGLLVGAGVGVSIDYSGVPKAIEDTMNWWNDLWK